MSITSDALKLEQLPGAPVVFLPEIDVLCGRLRDHSQSRQEFIENVVRLTSAKVGCSRAGLWTFARSEHGRRMQCLAMYDQTVHQIVAASDRSESGAEAYFEELARKGHVIAHDAQTYPATRGFFERKAPGRTVRSLMAASFALNGELFGALTCTQLETPVHWSPIQFAMLSRIGARATLALASISPNQLDTFLGPI